MNGRIYALMVTHNEADRYLQDALAWLTAQVNGVFVYDDQSTDDTLKVAQSFTPLGVHTWKRTKPPSFLEHEGRFRTMALRAMEAKFCFTEDDWVFMADADEFFVPFGETLWDLVDMADPGNIAIRIRIHSVWEQRCKELWHRIDGPWDTLYEPRLWKWREGLAFADKPMACRNEPVMVTMQPGNIASIPTGSAILHYGYASQRDRMHRYKRYTELPDHGHSDAFIESIVDDRVNLMLWRGSRPADVL